MNATRRNHGIEGRLLKARSEMLVEIIINRSVRTEAIELDIYRPIGRLTNLVDLDARVEDHENWARNQRMKIKVENTLRQNIELKHYVWFTFFISWSVVAVYDLLLFITAGRTILFWANDLLLIFGSVSMCITVLLSLMEQND